MLTKIRKNNSDRRSEKGSAMIEFALVAFTLLLVCFAIFEMERMLLVYNTLTNATRAGTRYAIVHGYNRSGSGVTGPSSADSHSNVSDLVTYLAGAGSLNASRLTVTVSYSQCSACTHSNDPGSTVSVHAVYAYDPFTALPLSFDLASTSQGVITF